MIRKLIAPLLVIAALAMPLHSASAEPAWDGFVNSTLYPIRVHYTNSAGLAKAEEALGYAESSWEIQVEQMGFTVPTTEDATGDQAPGIRIFLDPDAAHNQFEFIGDIPNTPWTDCSSRAIVTTLSPTWYFKSVVCHVMNKNMLLADDCGEGYFARKSTATAVQVLIDPEDLLFVQYCLPDFQSSPFLGLSCMFMTQELGYYVYGSGLFMLFLEEQYGSNDGTLLSNIWEAARQNGTVTVGGMGITMDVPNQPTLFDAIETVLGSTTLDEAFILFAEWRYFVGVRHDGEHFLFGDLWGGGEIAIESEWTLAALPLNTEVPNNLPNEYGSVYLSLDLNGIDDEHGVRFAFTGDSAATWNVDVLLLLPDGTADVQTVTLDAQSTGELTIEQLTGYDQAVFIVSNLGQGNADPDFPDCAAGATFYYDLEEVATSVPPQITDVDPAELLSGTDHHVWVNGADFADGAQVAFDSADVLVTSVTFIDESTLSVDLTVAAEAVPGPVAVTVTNPNTLSDTLTGAVTLIAPAVIEPKDTGCSCAMSTDASKSSLALWFLLLGLGLGLQRNRSRRRTPLC